jgi:hypothetical protein
MPAFELLLLAAPEDRLVMPGLDLRLIHALQPSLEDAEAVVAVLVAELEALVVDPDGRQGLMSDELERPRDRAGRRFQRRREIHRRVLPEVVELAGEQTHVDPGVLDQPGREEQERAHDSRRTFHGEALCRLEPIEPAVGDDLDVGVDEHGVLPRLQRHVQADVDRRAEALVLLLLHELRAVGRRRRRDSAAQALRRAVIDDHDVETVVWSLGAE